MIMNNDGYRHMMVIDNKTSPKNAVSFVSQITSDRYGFVGSKWGDSIPTRDRVSATKQIKSIETDRNSEDFLNCRTVSKTVHKCVAKRMRYVIGKVDPLEVQADETKSTHLLMPAYGALTFSPPSVHWIYLLYRYHTIADNSKVSGAATCTNDLPFLGENHDTS